MSLRNTENRYGSIAQLFHWIMAVMVIGMLCLGLYMTSLPDLPDNVKFYLWHKEFGILILMLVVFRLWWVMMNIKPLLPPHMAALEVFAAKAAHWAFYGFMIIMPIMGWMMSSAAGRPVSFFGLFTLPMIIAPNTHLKSFLQTTHSYLAFTLIGLIVAHTLASFKHHFFDKDDVFRRMLP